MRPMKLAGDQLMFGKNALEHLKTLKGNKAVIVTSGKSLGRTGILDKITSYLKEAKIDSTIFHGVEPDPSFATVLRGKKLMVEFCPDLIVAVGGGSVMDAAKAMWIYYEHPELTNLEDILPPNEFPKLHKKAKMICIPSTSGSASEVSRSIVITDDSGIKRGLGNMEMMPDIAICDPLVTASMPKSLTAATGMDALTHALEAYMSNRANHLSDILAVSAVKDIVNNLIKTYNEPSNLDYREKMINASFVAGMAFTNVSLGIVHSIAHTIGSYFHISHGLANAILLPYIIKYNSNDHDAKLRYEALAQDIGVASILDTIKKMNHELEIPSSFKEIIKDEAKFLSLVDEMAAVSLKDGCTKTNPKIPTLEEFSYLIKAAYYNKEIGV